MVLCGDESWFLGRFWLMITYSGRVPGQERSVVCERTTGSIEPVFISTCFVSLTYSRWLLIIMLAGGYHDVPDLVLCLLML